jgi:hypothetical protein
MKKLEEAVADGGREDCFSLKINKYTSKKEKKKGKL